MDTIIVGVDGVLGGGLADAYNSIRLPVWKSSRYIFESNDLSRIFLDLSLGAENQAIPTTRLRTAFLCAAVTSIVRCEKEPEYTRLINVTNTLALAKRLLDSGAFVIFLSSNAVFDGTSAFVLPDAPTKPQTEYGRQKEEVEQCLLSMSDRAAVVRLGKIVSQRMSLFGRWIEDLRKGKAIHPFSDFVMAPLSLEAAVRCLLTVADRQLAGINQMSATADISYAEAAIYIADRLRLDKTLIQPILSEEGGVLNPPRNTTLRDARLEALVNGFPAPNQALEFYCAQFHS